MGGRRAQDNIAHMAADVKVKLHLYSFTILFVIAALPGELHGKEESNSVGWKSYL